MRSAQEKTTGSPKEQHSQVAGFRRDCTRIGAKIPPGIESLRQKDGDGKRTARFAPFRFSLENVPHGMFSFLFFAKG